MAIYPILKRNTLNQVFGDFEKEINRIFENNLSFPKESTEWLPAIDIKEEKNQYLIHADLPGIDFKNIDVSVENNTLIIKGERESEKKENKEGWIRMERAKGSFYRSLNLPDNANVDKIDAKYDQGVLTVTIPKKEQSAARKVEIKANHSS